MSCQTRTWPSQPAPAPMPMVMMSSFRVTRAASLGGHALQHHGKGSRSLDGQRVSQQGGSPVLSLALDLESPKGVVRLGGHPDVGAHRDARPGDGSDLLLDSPAPSSFTASAPVSCMMRPALARACWGET